RPAASRSSAAKAAGATTKAKTAMAPSHRDTATTGAFLNAAAPIAPRQRSASSERARTRGSARSCASPYRRCLPGSSPPDRGLDARTGAPQAAEKREPFAIRARLRVLGRFERHGNAGEPAVVEEPAEGVQPEVAPADLLVAVEPGPERLLGIVEMKRPHAT